MRFLLISLLSILVVSCSTKSESIMKKGIKSYDKEDYPNAVKLLDEACKMNEFEACLKLGNMFSIGDGVVPDFIKAIEYYDYACQKGSGQCCSNAGVHYEYGDGVEVNKEKALEYYKNACNYGYQLGCKNYGKLAQEDKDNDKKEDKDEKKNKKIK